MKFAFIGLGVMGYPMAGHLKTAGFDVCVYNRSIQKAQAWVDQYGGCYQPTPALAAEGADVVMICVGNDDDVRQMVVGSEEQAGVLSVLKAGSIIIDHTTTSDELARELFGSAQKQSIHFIDAPVSGGQQGAENGTLAVMAGGEQSALEKITPVIKSYSKTIKYMGPAGSGQATKMVNQLLIAGVIQGMAEGFALANKSGLSLPQVIDAISVGAAGSWQLDNRGKTISEDFFDYGFAVDWMRKDLGFCLEAAKRYALDLPNAKHVDQCYEALQAQGHNRCDTSVLVKQYQS